MKIHRFYIDPSTDTQLKHDFWLHDEHLVHQWRKVLRFGPGQQVVLFDGRENERLYTIIELNEREAHLQLITDYARKTPAKEIYLFWSLLKKDKNDWVLQKCTELGVSHFIPLQADRCERTDLSHHALERWHKIVIEAAEQCGRSDIPAIREPMSVQTALQDYQIKTKLFICEQSEDLKIDNWKLEIGQSAGVLIGPEGGWSDNEKQLFKDSAINHLKLHDFTLRAETAAVAACAQFLS